MAMKAGFSIGIIALLIWACSPARQASKTSATLKQASQDSTEYEIIILDILFDNWYLLNYSPAKDYTKEYYQTRNLVGVTNWNYYYRSGRYTRVIESQIDYQPNVMGSRLTANSTGTSNILSAPTKSGFLTISHINEPDR
jgi:hypothetical protein